jgi:peroxiredoxin
MSRRALEDGSGAGPQPGDLAPRFDLRQTFEHNLSLDELLERSTVLLCFYVFDFGHV